MSKHKCNGECWICHKCGRDMGDDVNCYRCDEDSKLNKIQERLTNE